MAEPTTQTFTTLESAQAWVNTQMANATGTARDAWQTVSNNLGSIFSDTGPKQLVVKDGKLDLTGLQTWLGTQGDAIKAHFNSLDAASGGFLGGIWNGAKNNMFAIGGAVAGFFGLKALGFDLGFIGNIVAAVAIGGIASYLGDKDGFVRNLISPPAPANAGPQIVIAPTPGQQLTVGTVTTLAVDRRPPAPAGGTQATDYVDIAPPTGSPAGTPSYRLFGTMNGTKFVPAQMQLVYPATTNPVAAERVSPVLPLTAAQVTALGDITVATAATARTTTLNAAQSTALATTGNDLFRNLMPIQGADAAAQRGNMTIVVTNQEGQPITTAPTGASTPVQITVRDRTNPNFIRTFNGTYNANGTLNLTHVRTSTDGTAGTFTALTGGPIAVPGFSFSGGAFQITDAGKDALIGIINGTQPGMVLPPLNHFTRNFSTNPEVLQTALNKGTTQPIGTTNTALPNLNIGSGQSVA